MNDQDKRFLQSIADYCELCPSIAPYVADAARDGMSRALSQANERAADLEAVLLALATKPKSAWAKEILLQRLEKWKGKLSLNWESFIRREDAK
jgi:hypothetical protein